MVGRFLSQVVRFGCLFSLLLLGRVLTHADCASAQMLANPALNANPGKPMVGGGLVIQKLSYKYENVSADMDRKVLYGEVGFAINPKFDLYGQLGFAFSSAISDFDVTGSGYMFGFGPRFMPFASKTMKVESYGLVNVTNDEMKSDSGAIDVKLEQEMTDIHLGSTFTYFAAPSARPYVGLDAVLSSTGKIKSKAGNIAVSNTKVEREQKLALRLGANFPLGTIGFRPELILAGEKTIVLSLYSAM